MCPFNMEILKAIPEFRLKSSSRQDRSANRRSARTTDKGNENRWIYSLLSHYNKMKCELTKRIAQSTYSWWNAQKNTSTTTLTLSALQTQYNAATIDNDKPDMLVGTRAVYNSYYNLLQPQQRFMDSKLADAGFESLLFQGAPFVADSHAPASHLFLLNSKYISLCVHPDEDFRFEPFLKVTSQNIKVAKIYWSGNLTFSNLRLCGMFTALTA